MRIILLFLFACPLLSAAQINRSARELAMERSTEYIQSKAFKKQVYHPGSFSELKDLQPVDKKSDLVWGIKHEFEIEEPRFLDGKKVMVKQSYTFYFYLDDRMRVVKAETYYVE
ncbi:MAG TPA: hypothetical protein VHM26_15445 [Chitinophagaceae bacterium]|jgi:hypothetical protein|nr:hypothetical protein [Chitinophagaceae bacterium]